MKILIITYYFPPLNAIGSLRPYSWAKYWSKAGHDVTVLTTKKKENNYNLEFDYSSFKVLETDFLNPLKFINFIYKKGNRNNLISFNDKNSFLINLLEKFRNKYGFFLTIRMPDYTDLWLLPAYRAIKNQKWDLVVSTSGPYIVHLIAYKIKKSGNTDKWIADYRDLWTLNHIYNGIFPFTIIENIFEKKINLTADIITTVSEPLKNQMKKKYKKNNIFVIENGFDFDDLEKISKKNFWSDNKIRIIYTGQIYPHRHDPSPIFEAIKNISEYNNKDNKLDKLEIIFIGPVKEYLLKLIKKYKVEKWVKYMNIVPRHEALRMQREAYVLIFLENDYPDGILTGKLFEYLFSGTQIWGIGITENSCAGKLIIDTNCGIVLNKDVERIKNEILKLLTKGEKPLIYPKEEKIKYFSREKLAEKMLSLIKL